MSGSLLINNNIQYNHKQADSIGNEKDHLYYIRIYKLQ